MSACNFFCSKRNFTRFFAQHGKDRSCQRRLDFVAIFINFRDICGQT